MARVAVESEAYQLEEVSQNEDTFDTLGASRYSFFSPAILQKFLSISLHNNKTLTPFCNSVYATVLFADISGFTRLSSHINVESLKKHINQFFTTLLGVVKEFNGDVIKFCGDAVMIMWPVPSTATLGVKAATAYLAASCAMKLISDCGTYSKQEKGYKVLLRLHCGIGSGLVHCMCLGVGDRWEFLISGDPLRQVGIAESEAGIGEVCMAEESYSLVSEHFESIEMPEGSRNLIFSKQTKKTRGGGGAPPVTESPYVLQEKLQIPLETDLLNKLTNEQSRLNVASPMTPLITAADGLKITKSPTLSPGKKNLEIASPFSDEDKSVDINQQTSQDSKISEDKDKDTGGSPTDRSSVERSPLSIPTPSKRQNFFSPMFGQSPMTTTPDPSIDRELKRNISAAKAYLGEFTCSGYIPPWNIVPYLHKFLMDPAKMAIENDTLNYVAELREVVTIFIEILGLEDDFNMGFVRRPQRVIAIVIDCLDRFSGSLRQYVVDDKGCVIIAAFGLPGSSHEDNCVRAIEAATLIRDNFTEVKIECRIGIAKGMVYCGLVGSDDRCEYAMMGSSVNLAARLMGKGENGNILVNQDVQVATEKVFKFQALQKINAKGYVKPVAVFIPYERIQTHELSTHKSRLDSMGLNFAMLGDESEMKGEGGTSHATNGSDTGSSPKHLKKPKFIGRQTELATFQRSLEIFVSQDLGRQKSGRRAGGGGGGVDASSQGGGQTQQAHIVEGAAGAGKTWFVQEVIRMAKRMNGIQQIYICAATGQTQKSSQFYIIGQLMEQIFGISIMNTLMKGPEAGSRIGTPKGNASAVAQAAGVSMSMAPKRNATRDHIVAWFEKCDPDGRIISSKLISRDSTSSAGGTGGAGGAGGGVFESSNGLTTRKSLLVRGGSVAKFGRQLQKASSVDTISSLEIATGSSAYTSASSQLRKRMFASAKVSGEFVSDSYGPPSSGSLSGGGGGGGGGGGMIPEEIAEESATEEFETKEFHYSHLLPLLSDILPVQIEDNLITASLSFTDRKTYCEALIMYILEVALERQRTLLVVENIHWCDCSSLTYLTHWLQKKTGCFFLCTSRTCGESNATSSPPHLADMASCESSPLASTVPAFGRRRSQSGTGSGSSSSHHRKKALKMEPKFQDMDVAHVLSELYQLCASTALHFFSPAEIVTLLKSILGPTLLSQFPLVLNRENVEKIRSHTDGSPILTHILAVELEDALRKGIFRSVDDLPSGTDALILSRFDKLTTRDQIILKVASVWGQSFTTRDLYSVLYRLGDLSSSAGLADALTALVNSNLIQLTATATATANAGGGRGEAGSVGAGEGGQTFNNSNDSGEMLIVETNAAYSFVNRSIQDGIYYLMLETQRKQTHGVIGSLLEEKLETLGFNPLLFLAVTNHYMRSDLTAKKFEFLVRSAHLAKSKNDNYIANSHYGELIFMKTDRSVGDLLAESTTTTSSSTAQRGRILGGGFFSSSSSQQQHQLHPQQQLSQSRYRLIRQESMANIFQTDGFGTDRKWVRVNELKSRFQTREFISHKTICVWIGEVARARFNLGDFRSAHNLFILALFNAHLPLPSFPFDSCPSFSRDISSTFHTSTDIWSYLAHSRFIDSGAPFIAGGVGGAGDQNTVELNFIQFYLYLSFICFLHGSLHKTMYLLENARHLIRYISDNSRGEETVTEIKVLSLLAVTCYYCGKFKKAQKILHSLDHKCQTTADPELISAKLLGSAMIEAISGSFKDSRIKFRKAIDHLGVVNEGLLQHIVRLNFGWNLFLSGRFVEAQSTLEAVMSYAMSTDQTILLIWSSQLEMLTRLFSGEFGIIEVIAHKARNINRKDTLSTGTSAVLALALVVQRKFDQAVPHIRYACQKLTQTSQTQVSLQGYILSFCALYAGLCVLKWQQPLLSISSSQSSTMECLGQIVSEGMQRLYVASKTHGMLKILSQTLAIISRYCLSYLRDFYVPAMDYYPKPHRNTATPHTTGTQVGVAVLGKEENNIRFEYNEFIFGRAFHSLALALTVSESSVAASTGHPYSSIASGYVAGHPHSHTVPAGGGVAWTSAETSAAAAVVAAAAESVLELHLNEAETLFKRLSPANAKRMYQSCKNVLIPSHGSGYGGGGARSEFGDSVAQQPVRQTSLDSRVQQNSSESAAIPSLLSLSPRGRKTTAAGAASTGASDSIATSGNAWAHEHLPLGTSASASGAAYVSRAVSIDSPAISQLDLLSDQAQGQGQRQQTDYDNDVVEMEQYVPIRILVVDDAPTALKITTRVLTKIGYEVTTATNGLEAVDLIKDLTEALLPWFDAIILDIQMPIMDGLEACQKIRAMESKLLAKAGNEYHTSRSHGSGGGSGHQQLYHKKQLIVAVSVNADAESRVEAINSGFDYFMAKPFRVDEFETLLNTKELSSKN